MKATGPSVAILYFDPDKFRPLRAEQKADMLYLMERLFNGDPIADSAPGHFNVRIECEPDTDQGDEG